MKLKYQELIPAEFHPESRVWIYQSSRLFTLQEALAIEDQINQFVASWKTHGAQVKAYGNLLFGQFIVLIADETQATVSGCSTDSSVRFIKEIERQFNVTMFDRQMLAFLINDRVQVLPLSQVGPALELGKLTSDTLYFNNLVLTKQALIDSWIVPISQSWLSTRFLKKQ
ncbi:MULTISPECIES: hypothetical protein [unclassified Paraflavitalea]|uniref:hypothetical protein n=1 Tax=unclassified Paraflavitalea TaxID=2798305 RepID=UPI003D3464B3